MQSAIPVARNVPADKTSCPSLPVILRTRPVAYVSPSPSNVLPTHSTQKRLARRLACYTYSLACAIRWRRISLNGYESKAIRSHARQCMHESALRAMTWRNRMLEDAGQD